MLLWVGKLWWADTKLVGELCRCDVINNVLPIEFKLSDFFVEMRTITSSMGARIVSHALRETSWPSFSQTPTRMNRHKTRNARGTTMAASKNASGHTITRIVYQSLPGVSPKFARSMAIIAVQRANFRDEVASRPGLSRGRSCRGNRSSNRLGLQRRRPWR